VDNETKVETNSTLLLKTISLLNLKIFVREHGLSFILFLFLFFPLFSAGHLSIFLPYFFFLSFA
jgi:hypothetical protein